MGTNIKPKLKSGGQPTHGEASVKTVTREYEAWCRMIGRCYNENNKVYIKYGGRGIKVCDRWVKSYQSFLDDMGRRPSSKHSLDRYPDNNGNYEPANCRWATTKEQNRNYRRNRWFEQNGVKMLVSEWAEYFNISCGYLCTLLKTKTFEDVYKKHILINGVYIKQRGQWRRNTDAFNKATAGAV